jgi:hypothetical protein
VGKDGGNYGKWKLVKASNKERERESARARFATRPHTVHLGAHTDAAATAVGGELSSQNRRRGSWVWGKLFLARSS